MKEPLEKETLPRRTIHRSNIKGGRVKHWHFEDRTGIGHV